MASAKSPYVYALPYEVKKQLCSVLDSKNSWELLAKVMRDISLVDIEACRAACGSDSPAEILLTIWGSKGNTVLQLYNCLARIRLVAGMRCIRHLVDSKYHHWEQLCKKSFSEASTSSVRYKELLEGPNDESQNSSAKVPSSLLKNARNRSSPLSNMAEEGDVIVGLQSTINVKYREVLLATNNFAEKNILGRGGYGTAYIGVWKNFEVAVKRFCSQKKLGSGSEINCLKERLRQSLRELQTLAKYRHDNILPLYGISLDGDEPCLIYQYMANGSLEDRLQRKGGTEVLTWQQRKIIAEGTARGLLFLHTGSDTPIIHGDVKTANILLDRHFEPKLGDFGLCRSEPLKEGIEEEPLLIASHVKGTYAYLPPEYTQNKILSTKLDIYSYGIVLLEIASGLKVYTENRERPHLLQHVLHLEAEYEDDENKFISLIIDENCSGNDDFRFGFFRRLIFLALRCTNAERTKRPSCDEIVFCLENICNRQAFLKGRKYVMTSFVTGYSRIELANKLCNMRPFALIFSTCSKSFVQHGYSGSTDVRWLFSSNSF